MKLYCLLHSHKHGEDTHHFYSRLETLPPVEDICRALDIDFTPSGDMEIYYEGVDITDVEAENLDSKLSSPVPYFGVRSNLDRSFRAFKCLESEYNEEDIRTNMIDFLCDLHHLFDDRPDIAGDWENVLALADDHYIAEVSEESEEENA